MPPPSLNTAPVPSLTPPATNYNHSSAFSDLARDSHPAPSVELASDQSPPADTNEPPHPPAIEVPVESPSLRRSTRTRRSALELDPTSGRWIPKGSVSSLGWGNKLGRMWDYV